VNQILEDMLRACVLVYEKEMGHLLAVRGIFL
jgi:hypothetical protein